MTKEDDKTDMMPSLFPHNLGFSKPAKKADQETAEEDAEAATIKEPQAIPPADPFEEEIARIRRAQSPAVLEAIDASPCFGRQWYVDQYDDPNGEEESGICPEDGCDLREWCQLVWQRASQQQLDQSTESPPERAEEVLLKRPGKKRLDGKYLRHPYISTGRPVDKLAHRVWELLGGPPELPTTWTYPPAKTKEQQDHAAWIFKEIYGEGLICTKRQNYHQYFREGKHFLRVWVRLPGGAWFDLSPLLAKAVVKYTDLNVEQLSLEKRKTKPYWHYPYRIYIHKMKNLMRLAKAFEPLGIRPLADLQFNGPGGPGGDNEDQGSE